MVTLTIANFFVAGPTTPNRSPPSSSSASSTSAPKLPSPEIERQVNNERQQAASSLLSLCQPVNCVSSTGMYTYNFYVLSYEVYNSDKMFGYKRMLTNFGRIRKSKGQVSNKAAELIPIQKIQVK